ncbi:ATP-binding SpoIIE family protein phosphatase [Streptomyces sp. SBT349]|uniref:ATP-binding SpoIIE family protein phosphatase n=1 Tax=Streptomyces sp. SBT349 TaxID=1580539 RepID=UPI00099C5A45|nr:SpoIIE family protein phosphatase [Streptomyces sp. SBT349]
MGTTAEETGDQGFCFAAMAALVVDDDGAVVRWSAAAAELTGRAADEVCGRPVRELLAEPNRGPGPRGALPAAGRAGLRTATGGTVDIAFRVLPLDGAAESLVVGAPAALVAEWGHSMAHWRSLFDQKTFGVVLYDMDLKVTRSNITPDLFGGPALRPGGRMGEVMVAEDAEAAEADLRTARDQSVVLTGTEQLMRSEQLPGRQWFLSPSVFPHKDAAGVPRGVLAVIKDTTEHRRARDHLALLHEAAARIGGSLDIAQTARDLVDVLVPALGDLATVDLPEAVLAGEEPENVLVGRGQHLKRVAATSAGVWPDPVLRVGTSWPMLPDDPKLRSAQLGETMTMDRADVIESLSGNPELIEKFVPEGAHTVASAALFARGLILGVVTVWRTDRPGPFAEDERRLLAEIGSRAALGIDNARRYTREHRTAVALQERLLPRATTDTTASETAGFYQPSGGGAGISGDWFDVIRLPSLRVAFVVGDVTGHGLPATAAMGRLRTAIQTLADLELEPDDLLVHVDALLQRLAAETSGGQSETAAATCLYAVYDPVSRRCTLASAGQPPPVVIDPDGATRFIDVVPGPPLGVGGMPFESITVDLEPGTVLALYTDGLIKAGGLDLESGLQRLRHRLAAEHRAGRPLDEVGRAVMPESGDRPPRDDIVLLLARTRAVPPRNTARWEFPGGPESVARARDATTRQLAEWSLSELAFTAELVVSELVTNAIRHAGGPVGLRLIREDVLICEVTDPSNTQPRLRRAHATDEGGRGLFLVAQLTTRWGSRYGRRGKTIWTEQPLGGQPDPPAALIDAL